MTPSGPARPVAPPEPTEAPAFRCPEHRWKHVSGEPLACVHCQVLWPGEPLPKSPNQAAGYGDLALEPSWYSRVEAVRTELAELAS